MANQEYFIIGGADTDIADGFGIQDLTLDANLPGISTNIAAGGIKVFGSRVRISNTRVINFGTKTTALPGRAMVTAGAYPSNPEPFDCVVEDCIVDLPFRNSLRESHCIVLAGGEGATDGFMAYHKGCVVRNNYIDCHYSVLEAKVQSVQIQPSPPAAARTARIITTVKHNLGEGAWAVINGALEGSAPSNHFNGSFLTDKVDDYTFDILHHDASPGAVDPTGDMHVNRVPSHRVAIKTIAITGSGPYTIEVETKTPHYRLPTFTVDSVTTPAQNVVLNNIKIGGTLSSAWNKSFDISSVPSPYKFQFTSATHPGTPDNPESTEAYAGVDFYGITTAGGRGVIVEGNQLHSVTFGYYHSQFSTIDVALRDNYFQNVLAAVYGKLGQVSAGNSNQQPTRAGVSLTRGGTGNLTATFETQEAHGLATGQPVLIADAEVADILSTRYNGMFFIASVPSPKKFTYLMTADPGGNADTSPAPKFGRLWRVGRWTIENNVIELTGTITPGFDPPVGIRLERTPSNPVAPQSPYVFGQIAVLNNVIEMMENAFDISTTPLGIKLNNCEQAIVEDNVIKLNRSTPIEFIACGAIKFFNNQSPAGTLLQGYDLTNQRLMNELETDVDLAAVSIM